MQADALSNVPDLKRYLYHVTGEKKNGNQCQIFVSGPEVVFLNVLGAVMYAEWV